MVRLWVALLVCLALSGVSSGASDIEASLRSKILGSTIKRSGKDLKVVQVDYEPAKVRFSLSMMCSLQLKLASSDTRKKVPDCYLSLLRYHPGDQNVVLQKNCKDAKDQVNVLVDACTQESDRLWKTTKKKH